MPPFDVHFPLTAPGSEAGQAIERLEERLDSHVGLGEDQMLYMTVEADDLDAALELAARCGAWCLTGRGPYGNQLRLR